MAETFSYGEVDGVVATQRVVLCECACTAHDQIVDLHQVQSVVEAVERVDRRGDVGRSQPLEAGPLRERRVSLGLRSAVPSDVMCEVPDPPGTHRSGFLDEQRDERGGAEVGDHRRCSATSSQNRPFRRFAAQRGQVLDALHCGPALRWQGLRRTISPHLR